MHSERYLSVETSVDEKVAGQPAPPDPDVAAVRSMHRAKKELFHRRLECCRKQG